MLHWTKHNFHVFINLTATYIFKKHASKFMWNWRYWLKTSIFHWNGKKGWSCSRTTKACGRWWNWKWWWTSKYCIEYTTSSTKNRPITQLTSFKQSSKSQTFNSYAMWLSQGICVWRECLCIETRHQQFWVCHKSNDVLSFGICRYFPAVKRAEHMILEIVRLWKALQKLHDLYILTNVSSANKMNWKQRRAKRENCQEVIKYIWKYHLAANKRCKEEEIQLLPQPNLIESYVVYQWRPSLSIKWISINLCLFSCM